MLIFWNFVEILGRWNVFTEIWIEPLQYVLEIVLMTLVLLILTLSVLFGAKGGGGSRKRNRGDLQVPLRWRGVT